jgi:hypothetical protein
VDQGPTCHQFYMREMKTFDFNMPDNGEEEQAVTFIIISKYMHF